MRFLPRMLLRSACFASKSSLFAWASRFLVGQLCLLGLGCLLCLGAVNAQVVDPTDLRRFDADDPDADPNPRNRGPRDQRVIEKDTFGIFAFSANNPNEETAFTDSLLQGWQRYERDRKTEFSYANLGIQGSAAHPLQYQAQQRNGLDLGFHHFDLYQLDGNNMSFFRQQRPYTQLQFVQGSEQRDLLLDATFSRNFSDGVNFVLDYRRNSQRGRADQYPNQNLRNTNLSTGLWINHPGGKYDVFLSHASNTYEQQQNGGVVSIPERGGDFFTPFSARVFLEDAFLRQSHREWMATQYWQFGGRTDSLGRYRRAFTLSHQFRANNIAHRTTVPFAGFNSPDTAFYNRFTDLLVDERGQRNRLTHQTFQNSFRLSTFRRSGGKAGQASVQKDVLEVGLTHQIHRLRQEPRDSTINNLLLTAKLGFRPSDKLRFVAEGQLNLLDQLGDYRIKAVGALSLGKAATLDLLFLNQLYTPSVMAQQYWLNGSRLYFNNFNKTLENRLEGGISLTLLKLRLGLAYNLLTNYIFWDVNGLPSQAAELQNILQLSAQRNFRFGRLHLDNKILLQATNQAVIPLPKLLGQHSLYLDAKWFKVLNVNVGIDFRFFDRFSPYYFNPVLQQFQLQAEQENDFYLEADAFFSMRVRTFRFFIKYVQINQLWDDRLLSLVANYPYPDGATRIGISWRLLD